MGTRSFVGVMIGEKCHAVYVNFDGYLEGVGADLFQGYRQQSAVETLISHGDRSSLDGGYYKDCGEIDVDPVDVDPVDYDTFQEFYEACNDAYGEWYYIFKDGVWYCGNTYDGSPLCRKLTPYTEAVEIYKTSEETALKAMNDVFATIA